VNDIVYLAAVASKVLGLYLVWFFMRWAFWPKAYGGQGAIEHQRGLLNRKLAWRIV